MQDNGELARQRHLALRMPARLEMRIAQPFSAEQPLTGLVSMTWAA